MLTMGPGVHIVPIVKLSTLTFARWTHGGYDKFHPIKSQWNRFKFAIGGLWNRMCDWFDSMMPEAWNVEHNNRHHYCLSELEDPDLVENNLSEMRDLNIPVIMKWIALSLVTITWKWYYYAPNTYKELKLARWRKAGKKIPEGVIPSDAVTVRSLLFGGTLSTLCRNFLQSLLGPISSSIFSCSNCHSWQLVNTWAQDMACTSLRWRTFFLWLLTNVHAFIAIATNHAGEDMYRFRDGCRPYSGSFYLQQVLASVDFWTWIPQLPD